jgi:hypothetical protein
MTVTEDQGRSQVKDQQVRADTMSYDDAARRAEYHGKPVILTTADGVTEGLTMSFELAEDGKTLKRPARGGRRVCLTRGRPRVQRRRARLSDGGRRVMFSRAVGNSSPQGETAAARS